MNKKTKILLFAEGISMAHPSRMSQLCRQITNTHFELHIATPKEYHWLFNNSEQQIHLYDHPTISNQVFNSRLYKTHFPFTLQELMDFEQADEKLISSIKPDVIINDFRLSSYAAAKKNKIPLINLIQYHWHPQFKRESLLPHVKPVKIFGRKIVKWMEPLISPFILNSQLHMVNKFLEKHHLSEHHSIFEFYCDGEYLIFPDVPSLFGNPQLPENQFFIGPLVWKNTETPWPSYWPKDRTQQKTIYLTMGSTGNHELVPQLAKALSKENFRLFISTSGHKYPGIEQLPNTYLSDFVPAESVLKISDLIICNGGTSTTYHGIISGTPVFTFPTNMDQYLHSHQLKTKGVADYENFDELDLVRFVEKIFYLVSTEETKSHIVDLKNEITHFQKENHLNTLLQQLFS